MKTLRRVSAAAVLTVALLAASASTRPALATGDVPAEHVAQACEKLRDAIKYLEGLDRSRLVDFLLAVARRAEEKYCS